MSRKPKPNQVPDVFEQILGSKDRGQQAQGLEQLAMAAASPVYGLLIIMDSRPGKEMRLLPLGDRVPLAMLRALATQAGELITQQEVKAAGAAQVPSPALEKTPETGTNGDHTHANETGLPSPIPNAGPAAPRARRR